jgi:hypothetical protein
MNTTQEQESTQTCAVYKFTFADGMWYVGATNYVEKVLSRQYQSSHDETIKKCTQDPSYVIEILASFSEDDKGGYECDYTHCAKVELIEHKKLLALYPHLALNPKQAFDGHFSRKSRKNMVKANKDPIRAQKFLNLSHMTKEQIDNLKAAVSENNKTYNNVLYRHIETGEIKKKAYWYTHGWKELTSMNLLEEVTNGDR